MSRSNYKLLKEYKRFNLYLDLRNNTRECFWKNENPDEVDKARREKRKKKK